MGGPCLARGGDMGSVMGAGLSFALRISLLHVWPRASPAAEPGATQPLCRMAFMGAQQGRVGVSDSGGWGMGGRPPISAGRGGRSGAGEPQKAREAISIARISLMSGISCWGEESMALT